jgi:hypothetical protein
MNCGIVHLETRRYWQSDQLDWFADEEVQRNFRGPGRGSGTAKTSRYT